MDGHLGVEHDAESAAAGSGQEIFGDDGVAESGIRHGGDAGVKRQALHINLAETFKGYIAADSAVRLGSPSGAALHSRSASGHKDLHRASGRCGEVLGLLLNGGGILAHRQS